jgi:uncharacterized membrane protein YbhN (UPF0104 family)
VSEAKPPSTKSGLWRWAIALTAMVFVVRELASDPEPLYRLQETSPGVVLGFALLIALNQALMSQRFALAVTHASGRHVSALAWFRLISVGQMLNLFVPQLGTLYRGVSLKREHGVSYLSYASGLFAFVWLDQVAGFAIATLVIAVMEPGLRLRGVLAIPWLVVGVLGLLVVPFALSRTIALLRVQRPALVRFQARVSKLLENARTLLGSRACLKFVLLNVLVTIVQVVALALLFDSVGAKMPFAPLLLFQVLLKLSNQVVITPGNLGIMELMFGALAYSADCTLEQGLAVSLLFRVITSLVVIVLGVLFGGATLLRGRGALLDQGGVDEDGAKLR